MPFEILQSDDEIEFLKEVLEKVKNIEGVLVEVGVYRGGTAEIIRKAILDRPLHLFDTFEGFIVSQVLGEDAQYNEGELRATIQKVRTKLQEYGDVHFHKGDILETKRDIENTRCSFVHLDVDIYVPTKESLEFFWPMMNHDGIILIDDYCKDHFGLRRAVDEFCLKHNIIIQRGYSRYVFIKK